MNLLKLSLWIVGGLFALGMVGVLVLYGAAALAMWGNAKEIERAQARREAAFKALTPAQHLAEAKRAFEEAYFAGCRHHLLAVPENDPERTALWNAMVEREAARRAEEEAFAALSPAEHLARAEVALDAKDFPTCRHHLMYVPRETAGAQALMDRRAREEDAWDRAQDEAKAKAAR
jgi:hypothetical protein